jgi:tripartite-type tricarboxylate transporter receptor subunit TctC
MGAELLSLLAGARMLHVPYKGVADAYPGVASGQVDWILGNPVSVMPLIKAGRLKAIAVTSARRIPLYPEVPTVAESGVPGYEVVGWYGIFGPAHLPAGLANILSTEAHKRLNSPEIRKKLEATASDPVGNTPAEFAREVESELQKWRELVKQRGIKLSGTGLLRRLHG